MALFSVAVSTLVSERWWWFCSWWSAGKNCGVWQSCQLQILTCCCSHQRWDISWRTLLRGFLLFGRLGIGHFIMTLIFQVLSFRILANPTLPSVLSGGVIIWARPHQNSAACYPSFLIPPSCHLYKNLYEMRGGIKPCRNKDTFLFSA